MKVFVGLGNPGLKYRKTRHNAGAMFIDAAAKQLGLRFKLARELRCNIASGTVDGEKVLLVKPDMYMNTSGEGVFNVKRYYKVADADLFVIYDELDLPVGTFKIKPFGSSGGHKGMQSVIDLLKTEQLARLRIGIASPLKGDPIDFVLSKFSKEEFKLLEKLFNEAGAIVRLAATKPLDIVMNKYNTQGS